MKWKLLSDDQLFATPWTVACQAPLSMEFSRQEYWSGLPFPSPGDLPDPGIEPGSPTLQADLLWNLLYLNLCKGLPWWLRWERICLQCRKPRFDPWVGKIPWRRKWQSTPGFLPGKSHGQRGLVGYSPWSHKESETTEELTQKCFLTEWSV